jgi:hypothetical protein
MEEKFTIEEIRTYLEQQDSFGDIFYNLSAANIKAANKKITVTYREILEANSANWVEFCDKYGVNEWVVNEGGGDNEIQISIKDAKDYGLI